MYQAMTDQQTETLLSIALMECNDPEQFSEISKKIFADDFVCKVIKKRIEAYKLDYFSDSSIIFISLLCSGNPGKSVLAMIDALEALQKTDQKQITLDFMCQEVYPLGFYTPEAFRTEFERRRENRTEGFNYLI